MLRNFNDICNAIFAKVDLYKELYGDDYAKWKDARENDMQLKFANKVWKTYNRAEQYAKTLGYVGVGCISYAEQRAQEYQKRLAKVLA